MEMVYSTEFTGLIAGNKWSARAVPADSCRSLPLSASARLPISCTRRAALLSCQFTSSLLSTN